MFVDWWVVQVSPTSALYGVAMGLRFVAFIVLGVILLSTTPIEDLRESLCSLWIPFRFAFAIVLCIQLLPRFVRTAIEILEAQRLRGLDLGRGNPLSRLEQCLSVSVQSRTVGSVV